MRFKLYAKQTSAHSLVIWFKPPNDSRAKADHRFDDAETDSTVCLRKTRRELVRPGSSDDGTWSARGGFSGSGYGSLWRSHQRGWCSSRTTALSGSMLAASRTCILFSLQKHMSAITQSP